MVGMSDLVLFQDLTHIFQLLGNAFGGLTITLPVYFG